MSLTNDPQLSFCEPSGWFLEAVAAPSLPLPPQRRIGLLGVSLAFGLTVLSMAYAIGTFSGCHSLPRGLGGIVYWKNRFSASVLLPFSIAHTLAIAAIAESGAGSM
jgi:glycerol uptake facilitator-like aquaporin